jgi:hypothetical protein
MKKLGLWLFIPLLVSTVLMGGEATGRTELEKANQELAASAKDIAPDAATIAQYQNSLALKSIFSRDRFTKAEPAAQSRARQRHTYRHEYVAPWMTRFQSARSTRPERPATLQKGMGIAALIGAEVLDTSGEPISAYTIGDTISIVINYAAPVTIELWVDEGDGTFDPETDLWFSPGDGEDGDDEIIVQDGDEDDEDPTVGVWQITFDTGEMDEGGELFGLQGARLFLQFYSDAPDTGSVTLDALPPASTTMLSGEVDILDPPGPAANAIVVAFPTMGMDDGDDGPETLFITMTDDTGHYELAIPDDEAGQQFMVFAMDAFGLFEAVFPVPTWHDPFVGVGANIPGLNFTLEPATATIFGTLTDQTGAGIGGIRVYASMDGPFSTVDTTAANGSYSVDVIPGWWRVRPNGDDLVAAGYMGTWSDEGMEVFDGANGPIDFMTFATDGTIQGHVAWSTGEDAVGIEVGTNRFDFDSFTETDASGNYTLYVSTILDTMTRNPDEPDWYQDPGYWVNVWTDEALSSPPGHGPVSPDSTGIDFLLYEVDAWLVGTVYDEDMMEPLCEAQLNAHTVNDTLSLWSWAREECDWDGSYELPLVSGHEYVVEIYRPWECCAPAFIDSIGFVYPGETPKDFYVPGRAEFVAIDGHVFNMEGHPIANARVEIIQRDGDYYREVFTDEEGYFRVEDAPAFAEFDATAFVKDQWQHQPVWTSGMDVYIAFWMGEIRYRIDGVVLNDMEEPVPGAFVLAYVPDNDLPVDGFFTGEDGYYELFLKGGSHTVKAGAPGFSMNAWTIDVVEDTTHDFMLAPAGDALTASITGRVTSPGGWGVGWTFVAFVSDAYIAYTWTGSDGYYSFDLVPGEYLSFYQKEGFQEYAQTWSVTEGVSDGYNVVLNPEAFLKLDQVFDVPDDHGKQMMLQWSVNPIFSGRFTRFVIWELGTGPMDHDPFRPDHGPPPRHVRSVPIHPDFEEYAVAVGTLRDDVETWYMVTAHGESIYEYWDSNWMSSMSHDDLAPMIPTGVVASLGATPLAVNVSWAPSLDDPAAETPVQYYTIYRAAGMTQELARVADSPQPMFTDELSSEGTYRYAISATDFGGNESAMSEEEIYATLGIVDGMGIPEEYALKANYPNPFNPTTTIVYGLPEAGMVSLKIYDLTGKLIRTLVNEALSAGYHRAVWDGKDASGAHAATGVYFYRISAGDRFAETRKMVLMK